MSSSTSNRQTAASKGGTGTTSTPANNVGGFGTAKVSGERRRSSGGNTEGLFSGLVAQKRNSGDASAAARKASFDEMKPAPGVIGSMWNSFTKGTK
ncbi:MAG: hypothetical protein M1825_000322 [Sarcosagium campestre]|nr:MAG: hypothetical protein M1825_000322 [Sarcosagium campestre]